MANLRITLKLDHARVLVNLLCFISSHQWHFVRKSIFRMNIFNMVYNCEDKRERSKMIIMINANKSEKIINICMLILQSARSTHKSYIWPDTLYQIHILRQ